MMKAKRLTPILCLMTLVLVQLGAPDAFAGSHTWRVNEVFSNASGTIQFIELRESGGGAGEVGVNGHFITSNAKSFQLPGSPLAMPTSFKTILIATSAFAATPGAPTPDYIIPAGLVPSFFATTGDTVQYVPWSSFTFGAGVLPTDGVHSLNANLSTGCNTPTNYAGQTGTINVGCSLRGDVDGSGALNGQDIAAFLRAKLGGSIITDVPACAEYCTGSLDGDVLAFVQDLLS